MATSTPGHTSEPHPGELQRAAERAYELDRAHLFHSWSAQASLQPMTAMRTVAEADANEHAIRMARLHTVLARYRSYHGGTETAINVTGELRR